MALGAVRAEGSVETSRGAGTRGLVLLVERGRGLWSRRRSARHQILSDLELGESVDNFLLFPDCPENMGVVLVLGMLHT